jgi:hypothetical protein
MQTVSSVSGLTVFSLLVPLVVGISPSFARQTTITGTAGTVADFRERSYKQGDSAAYPDEGDTQKIGIRPEVLIVSKDVRDTISMLYSPTFNYDFVAEDNEVDHQFNLQGERWLSQHWSISVTDSYISSDDVGTASTSASDGGGGQPNPDGTPDELSRDLNGRKYWTNTATARTNFALAKDSRIGGGYSYSVLRNEDDISGDEDYDKHSFFGDLSHSFTQNWRSNLGLNYTRGLYDTEQNSTDSAPGTPDLNQYGARLGVDYVRNAHDFYPLKYSFSETQYDTDTRSDSQSHQWSAGWDHAFDSRTRLALGGGPSFAKTEGLEGTWGYNAYLTFNRAYEHAAYALSFSKLYEMKNFTGSTGDSGLTDTYNAKATFTYRHTQALSFDLFGRYSWESNLDPQGEYRPDATGGNTGDITYDKDIYEAGIGCAYSFARWYKAGLKYSYYVSDGKLASDQYTDHQVLVTLSTTRELWRW